MQAGFEYPIALVLLVLVAGIFGWALTHKKRGALFHPWSEHLKARVGSGTFRSRIPLVLFACSAVCMTFVIALPWVGYTTRQETQSSRMIGLVLDVSGSMTGVPLETARLAAQNLIEKRPDDRIGVIFFASEANYSAFGIPTSFLSKEKVYRRAEGLGGSTVATHGLFTAFAAMAREDGLLTEEELRDIYAYASQESNPATREPVEAKRERLRHHLDALLSVKKLPKADRLVVFFSDCDLMYNDYDIASVMMLYQRFDIRVELVCITYRSVSTFEQKVARYSEKSEERQFLDGLKATGGKARMLFMPLYPYGSTDAIPELEHELQEIFEEINMMKPREITLVQGLEKRYLAREFLIAALFFLVLAEVLASLRWFRINA